MLKCKHNGYDSISATAWQIAHRRTFTDIPYSQEIFDEFERILSEQGRSDIPEELISPQIAPQIKARYKLVSRLLVENSVQQVLEIATGLSPRGLQMTNNSNIEYVEVGETRLHPSRVSLGSGFDLGPSAIESVAGINVTRDICFHENLEQQVNTGMSGLAGRAVFGGMR
jgi:hypothetical protein